MRSALPNSPLGEVAFELRFPGDLNFASKWGELQRALQSDFPMLFVPNAKAGEPLALTPYRLSSSDEAEFVALSLNMVAFMSKRYKTFDAFRERFGQVFEVVQRYFAPRQLNRVGLRYVNWIPRQFGDAPAGSIHPALKLQLAGVPGGAPIVDGQLVFHVVAGELTLRVSIVADPASKQLPLEYQNTMLLDFDCFAHGEISPARVDEILVASHAIIDDTFFGLITDEYLKFLKGES